LEPFDPFGGSGALPPTARFFDMARYEHLPIYKAALDLTVHLERVVAGFSRYQIGIIQR